LGGSDALPGRRGGRASGGSSVDPASTDRPGSDGLWWQKSAEDGGVDFVSACHARPFGRSEAGTVVVKSDPYPRDFGWVASSRGAERIFRVVDACGRAIFTYRPSAARPVRMGRGRKHTTKRPVGKGSVYVLSEREGRACEGLRRRALPGFQCGRPRGEFWSARHDLQRGVREVTGSGSGKEGSRGMWPKVGNGCGEAGRRAFRSRFACRVYCS